MNRPINILLVEDNPGDARLMKEELGTTSSKTIIQLEWVERLDQGLERIASTDIDAILLDLSLPDSQGLETLYSVLTSAPSLPIIVMTGQANETVAMQAVEAGAQDYLIKGQVDGRLLMRSIQYAIQRKRAEEALRESEENYRQLFEAESDAIFLIENETGQILRANNAACVLYGYSREELLAKKNSDLSAEPEQTSHVTKKTSITPDQVIMIPLRFHRKKDGTVFPVEITGRFFLHQGRPVHIAAMRDSTERKRAEEVLQEKERLLAEAQRIGHIGSWNYDISTDMLQYSDEMYRLFDISPQEFQHSRQGFLNLIYSSDQPEVTRWMERIVSGRQVQELDFRVLHTNGELRYIQSRGAVKFDSNGNPERFIGTAQDITERKLADIQIHQQIERLTALRKVDQAITSSFDLSSTLNTVLSQTITQLQVDAVDVLLLNPAEQVLEYAAGQGFRTRSVETARVPVGESHAGRVARERRLIKIEDLQDQPTNLLLTTLLAGEDFVCYFGVPLIVKGKVKGVLEVYHRVPLQPYPEWLDFLDTLAGQAAIAIDNATLFEKLQYSNRELIQAYDATIEGWSRALDLRDRETEGHTQRVAELTISLARRFGCTKEELLHIRRGALLHDIGKMGVPDNILLKPEPLTEMELTVLRKHTQYAYELLSPINFLQPALDIPYCHHEKWDGTGYPRGLQGEAIPFIARLFAIVDVWDALTSDRPYRPAWKKEAALAYIREQSGLHFDPQVVDLFFRVMGETAVM